MQQLKYFLITSLLVALFNIWATSIDTTHESSRVDARTPVVANAMVQKDESNFYYFTMTLPDRGGGRFSKISLTVQANSKEAIPLPLDSFNAKAFLGSSNTTGAAISIRDTWIDETGTIWIEFNPALAQKTQLTVALKAQKLPTKTVYTYGIAAYPDVKYPVPVFVRDGNLTIE